MWFRAFLCMKARKYHYRFMLKKMASGHTNFKKWFRNILSFPFLSRVFFPIPLGMPILLGKRILSNFFLSFLSGQQDDKSKPVSMLCLNFLNMEPLITQLTIYLHLKQYWTILHILQKGYAHTHTHTHIHIYSHTHICTK